MMQFFTPLDPRPQIVQNISAQNATVLPNG